MVLKKISRWVQYAGCGWLMVRLLLGWLSSYLHVQCPLTMYPRTCKRIKQWCWGLVWYLVHSSALTWLSTSSDLFFPDTCYQHAQKCSGLLTWCISVMLLQHKWCHCYQRSWYRASQISACPCPKNLQIKRMLQANLHSFTSVNSVQFYSCKIFCVFVLLFATEIKKAVWQTPQSGPFHEVLIPAICMHF